MRYMRSICIPMLIGDPFTAFDRREKIVELGMVRLWHSYCFSLDEADCIAKSLTSVIVLLCIVQEIYNTYCLLISAWPAITTKDTEM